MTPDRIQHALRHAEYGTAELLDAVEGAMKSGKPALLAAMEDRLERERRREADERAALMANGSGLGSLVSHHGVGSRLDERFRANSLRHWQGPRGREQREAPVEAEGIWT